MLKARRMRALLRALRSAAMALEIPCADVAHASSVSSYPSQRREHADLIMSRAACLQACLEIKNKCTPHLEFRVCEWVMQWE